MDELYEYCKYKRLSISRKNGIYVIYKKYYGEVKLVFAINVLPDRVKIEYGNGTKEEVSKEEFIEFLKRQLKEIKLLRKWYSSGRVIRKMSYVHMKMTEYGLDYVKSKSGVNFNIPL
jgi:hypothetical protein